MLRGPKEWERPSEAYDHYYGMEYQAESMFAVEQPSALVLRQFHGEPGC